jgi:uncharacterized membrane protein
MVTLAKILAEATFHFCTLPFALCLLVFFCGFAARRYRLAITTELKMTIDLMGF